MEVNLIINISIGIVGVLVGFLSGIYLPNKFRKDDKNPFISTGAFQERFNLFEITNHGGDLIDLNIEISWLQNGKEERRELIRFLNSSDDPLRDRPHTPGSIKKGETKKVIEFPKFSDNGEVRVYIQGKDLKESQYNKELVIKNCIKK